MPEEIKDQTGTTSEQGELNITTLSREKLEELKTPAPEQGEGEESHVQEKEPEQKPAAEKKDGEPPAAEKQPDTINKTDHDALKAEHEKLKEKWANQEKLLQRFGNEVGIMRKMSPEEVQTRLQKIREMYNPESDNFDPVRGNEEIQRLRADQGKEVQREEIAKLAKRVTETREVVKQHVPEFETGIEDLAGLIKEDGAGEEYVKAFKENPYLLDHTTLFNMHKRLTLSRENATLKTEVERLKTENESLKKKPDEMLKRIENASNFRSESAASKGASSQAPGLYNKLPAQMTREELKAAMELSAKSGG